MTAKERLLSYALEHTLHQLALYVGPQDTATLALLRDYRRLLRQVKKNRRVSNRMETGR